MLFACAHEQRALADGGEPAAADVSAGALCQSAGVRKGELDPFAVAVMAELGQDISTHKPKTFEELEDWEGLNFDLIITLSPEAHHKALELTRTLAADVEYWPTQDPTAIEGSREQKLDAYREVCDRLLMRIRRRLRRSARRAVGRSPLKRREHPRAQTEGTRHVATILESAKSRVPGL